MIPTRSFLVQVRAKPADNQHCERSGHKCPLLKKNLDCIAFGKKLVRDWSRDAYACAFRCEECLAAEPSSSLDP